MTPITINPWPILIGMFMNDKAFNVAFLFEPQSEREKRRLLIEDRKQYRCYLRRGVKTIASLEEEEINDTPYALSSGDCLLYDKIESCESRIHRLKTTKRRLDQYSFIKESGRTRDNSYYTIEPLKGSLTKWGRFRSVMPFFSRYPVNKSDLYYVPIKEGEENEYNAFFDFAIRMTHQDTLQDVVSRLKSPY